MKSQLNSLLDQEMDRKEFLRYIGVAVLMFAGGGLIMQALGARKDGHAASSYGYGSNTYGGRR